MSFSSEVWSNSKQLGKLHLIFNLFRYLELVTRKGPVGYLEYRGSEVCGI